MSVTLPIQGVPREELVRRMQSLRGEDANWREGRTFSLVYHAGEEHERTLKAAYDMFFSENALNPMAFKSLRRMEAEVVRMAANLFHGGPSAVGTMTSGGTESILMAVKAARDRGKGKLRKGARPSIVAPETIHPAFDKAAAYFGLDIRYARLRSDYRADVKDLESLVDATTVLIAASAPQYPHGVIDPISDVSEIALRRRIPFHVDACVGGYMLPWVERLGYRIPLWDFRVPGVTSISADLHKYGFTTKGASSILYRDMSYLRHQFFVSTDFPGGIYASPTAAGSRPGGAIAAAWASLMTLGEEGFLHHTDRAMKAAQVLVAGVESIPELEVIGKPDATIVSWRTKPSSKLDTYVVADGLEDRGWLIDRQHHPASVHCTVTSNHDKVIHDYVKDLRASVAHVASNPGIESRGNAAMYGMMAKIPFRGMVKSGVLDVMERLYGPNAADADFDPMGASEEGGVMRMVKTYGGKVLSFLDRAEALRDKLRLRPKRRQN